MENKEKVIKWLQILAIAIGNNIQEKKEWTKENWTKNIWKGDILKAVADITNCITRLNEEEKRTWECTNDNCRYTCEWSYDNLVICGEPVCDKCDDDMALAVYCTNCKKEHWYGVTECQNKKPIIQKCYCTETELSVPHYTDDHDNVEITTDKKE